MFSPKIIVLIFYWALSFVSSRMRQYITICSEEQKLIAKGVVIYIYIIDNMFLVSLKTTISICVIRYNTVNKIRDYILQI